MPRRLIWQIGLVVSVVLGKTEGVAADGDTRDDASLYAVQFVNAQEGWAVGDEGIVWHTVDGGEKWERQPAHTTAMLTAIHMLSPQVGVIGGRTSALYHPGSTGVMLHTRDGGAHWSDAGPLPLSGVVKIHFADEVRGWVIAETTESHPTGVFFTTDGGRRWNALRGSRTLGWTAAFFPEFDQVVLAGHDGAIANVHQGVMLPAQVDWLAGSAVRDLAGDAVRLFAVGDQGQVFFSTDQGRSWRRPDLDLERVLRGQWDLRAVAAVKDHVWVAGRPGSVVLHSSDAGRSWTIERTGQPLPINDICFVDELRGWAVGPMGMILATNDGGKNWTIQRQGGGQAAILWLDRDAGGVPLSVVARYGADEGYRVVALTVTARDARFEPPGATNGPRRFHEAIRSVGGTLAESSGRFPLPPGADEQSARSILDTWNVLHENRADEELVRELVLAIRIWRPFVAVIPGPEPALAESAVTTVVGKAARRAFDLAADPVAYPEQIQQLHLRPHAVSKLYGHMGSARGAAVGSRSGNQPLSVLVLHGAGEIGSRISASFADVAEVGMGLLHETYRAPEPHAAFVLTASRMEGAEVHRTLTQGLRIAPGSPARRRLPAAAANADEARKQAERKRNLLAIADQPNPVVRPDQLLAQLQETVTDLSPQRAGQVIFYLARRFIERGQWELAHNAFVYLVENHPEHPLSREAYAWLIAFQVSGEARMRALRPLTVGREHLRVARVEGSDGTFRSEVSRAAAIDGLTAPNAAAIWNQRAIEFGQRLRKTASQAWSDPRIQLNLAAAQRRLGFEQTKLANAHYDAILGADPESRWSAVIGLEKWFFARELAIPRPIAWSIATTERPFLDGKLDDNCWVKGARPLALKSGNSVADRDFGAIVRLRHDREFLYVSALCRVPDSRSLIPPASRTERDANLDRSDRIEIMLDLDRDYTSYYRLCINQRGLVAEDCWGDRTWDPRWFVAHDQDAAGWRLEAAIPLAELTDAQSLTGAVWAFNVMRVVPDAGVFAWTRPASPDVRTDGFTFLKFIDRGDERTDLPRAN
jgi:photosystem II stability/assembly factor-like uncharacterized protein